MHMHANNVPMPCRTVLLRKDAFDEREMDFYEALYTQSQAQFGAYVESGTVLNNYAHIFDLLIRLRQVRLHICVPYSVGLYFLLLIYQSSHQAPPVVTPEALPPILVTCPPYVQSLLDKNFSAV